MLPGEVFGQILPRHFRFRELRNLRHNRTPPVEMIQACKHPAVLCCVVSLPMLVTFLGKCPKSVTMRSSGPWEDDFGCAWTYLELQEAR